MEFVFALFSLLGFTRRVDFGKVDPNDVEAYWRLERDIDQAERKGRAELAAALSAWGLRDMKHYEAVKEALNERHGNNPDFSMAAARVNFEAQMNSGGYQLPASYSVPPHGITLDRYAAIKARIELGQELGSILASYQLNPSSWGVVEATWAERMGPGADAMASAIFRSQFGAMHRQALAVFKAN
jgi:hypothetical protein